MAESTPQPSFQEFQFELKEKEQEITEQLDRIYELVEAKKPLPFIQLEFQRAVERISEKYQILNALLLSQKEELTTADFDERADALKGQFSEDVVVLAAAIDEAAGTALAGSPATEESVKK